jgi:hypothetical protein
MLFMPFVLQRAPCDPSSIWPGAAYAPPKGEHVVALLPLLCVGHILQCAKDCGLMLSKQLDDGLGGLGSGDLQLVGCRFHVQPDLLGSAQEA